MDFFDKLGQKANEAYKLTADKTGKIAKEAKIKMKMNELKCEIDDLYNEIGKKVYERHCLDEEIDIKIDLEEECTKIDLLSSDIESLLNQSLELKDKKVCIKCFKEINKDMKYCFECGTKQDIDEKNKDKNQNNNEDNIENKKQTKKCTKTKKSNNNNEKKCEDSTLLKTVKVESDPKLKKGEAVQEIKFEEEDKLD